MHARSIHSQRLRYQLTARWFWILVALAVGVLAIQLFFPAQATDPVDSERLPDATEQTVVEPLASSDVPGLKGREFAEPFFAAGRY